MTVGYFHLSREMRRFYLSDSGEIRAESLNLRRHGCGIIAARARSFSKMRGCRVHVGCGRRPVGGWIT